MCRYFGEFLNMHWQECAESLDAIQRAKLLNSAGMDAVIFLFNGELKALSRQSHQWNFSECEIVEIFKAQ